MSVEQSPFSIRPLNEVKFGVVENGWTTYAVTLSESHKGQDYPVLTDENWEQWKELRKTGAIDQKIYYAVVFDLKYNKNFKIKNGPESWSDVTKCDAIQFHDDGTVTRHVKVRAEHAPWGINLRINKINGQGHSLRNVIKDILPPYAKDPQQNFLNRMYRIEMKLELRNRENGVETTSGFAPLIAKTNADKANAKKQSKNAPSSNDVEKNKGTKRKKGSQKKAAPPPTGNKRRKINEK